MPIHLNPFRVYKGRICLNHGILVEILRCTAVFWDAYKDILEVNNKRKSHINDLHSTMKQMGIAPKKRRKITEKHKQEVLLRVTEDFRKGSKDINKMMGSLNNIVKDDETFLYRTVKELRKMYLNFRKLRNPAIPAHRLAHIQHQFYDLIERMEDIQHHTWIVSKAHSRGFTKLAELSIRSDFGVRYRIRRSTLELDHISNSIRPLRYKIRRLEHATNQDSIHKLDEDIRTILHLYHIEMSDLKLIMQEADILIRRTENLFKAIEHEAHILKVKELEKIVHKYAQKLNKLLRNIEKMARREYQDIKQIMEALPDPLPLTNHEALTTHQKTKHAA